MTMPTSDGEINQEIPDVYRRQIEWYDSHAIRYRHWYLGFEAALLILAAITAVLTTIHSGGAAKRTIGWRICPLSHRLAVVILAGILNLFSFQEHWLNQGDLRKAAARSQVVAGAWRRLHKCSGPAADIC
jgi:Protein of unknown function (DUF4231)